MKFELNLRKRNISKDDLVADLLRVSAEIEQGAVTADTYSKKGKYGVNTMSRRFGSWNNALSAAGLVLNNRVNIKDKELFENLANIWQKLGHQPFGRNIEKSGGLSKFSLGTYEARFGSWNNALEHFINYINGNINNDSSLQEIVNEDVKLQSQKKTPRKINWRLRAAF